MDGIWGPPTASMDWCEANYVHTPWVAEMWNAVSSGSMVVAGVWGWWTQRGKVETRFVVAYALLVLVGLGSVAFHGTLLRGTQLLDQLPMLYLVLWLTWILTQLDPARALGRWFAGLLIAHTILVTALTLWARGPTQFMLFHVSFASLEFYCLGRVAWLQSKSTDPELRRRCLWALSGYAGSLVVWFADLKECEFLTTGVARWGLPRVEWHAVWHAGISISFSILLGIIATLRREAVLRVRASA